MFTPQQIDQISFDRASFGGYKMEQVDEFLVPLTEDYVALYKENGLLKSKMRVLVGKLEEYRKNEAAMKDAVVNAQRTCDKMIREAEAKCAQMMSSANATAAANAAAAAAAATEASRNTDALVAAEDARVEEARRAAAAKINELQEQLRTCIQALERIKGANAPAAAPAASSVSAATMVFDSAAVADEISSNLEAIVGTTTDHAPKAAPKHPVSDTTSKFTGVNLQFGRNYDASHK